MSKWRDDIDSWYGMLNLDDRSENLPAITLPFDLTLDGHKTGYEYLYELCKKVRNKSFALGDNELSPMTERATYIINQLNSLDLNYKIIPFSSYNIKELGYGENKLANIQVFFKATKRTKKTIVFTAHHDIANPNSENCQDNSASVCNLIYLCDRIQKLKFRNKNVYIVFTDCEEFGGRGASKMCSQILKGEYGNVESVISLELTANGTEMWVEGHLDSPILETFLKLSGKKGNVVRTPYNESYTIRRHGIDSVCVGILPKNEMSVINGGGGYGSTPTWSLCHSIKDTFERSANKKNMKDFVYFLRKFINH